MPRRLCLAVPTSRPDSSSDSSASSAPSGQLTSPLPAHNGHQTATSADTVPHHDAPDIPNQQSYFNNGTGGMGRAAAPT